MGDMYSGDYAERLRRQLTENEDKIINTINQKRQSGENGVPQTRPLYKIHYTDEQYKYLRAMAEERKLSEDEIYRLNTAMAISENYNIPLDHVTKNLEAYVAGIGVDTSTALPKKWYIGVGKAFTNGLKGMRQGQLAWDLFTREMDGEDEITKLQRKRIADINRQIQFDSDYDPANLAVRALEDAAQSLPYTVYVGGAGILGSLLNPAVGTAAAWAAATQSMIGMEYYDLTEAGIDKDIARGTAFGSTFVQGGIEAFLGETVRLAGKGAMSLGGKKAMESLSRRIAGFVLPRMKTDGVFLNFAARQMVEMPLRMAEEGAEEGSQSLTASLSFNIAAALQNKRTYSEALSIMIGEGAAPEEAKQTLDALIAELKNGGKAEGGKAEELLNEKYVHQKKAREIVSDMNESFWGGVRAAAIFGTADIVLSAKTSRREAEKARFDAAQNPSKENFINEHKDGTISEDILGRIHDSQRTARDKSLKPDIDAAKELYALGPGVEKKQFDDEGKPVEVGSPFRKENGRLHTGIYDTKMENGVRTEQMRFGNGAEETSHNLYGYADIRIEGDTAEITALKVDPRYEGVTEEFYREIARQYAKYDIKYNPVTEAGQALKQRLIDNNTRGQGLNYYTAEGVSTQADKDFAIDKIMKSAEGNTKISRLSASVVVDTISSYFENARGANIRDVIDTIEFTTTPTAAVVNDFNAIKKAGNIASEKDISSVKGARDITTLARQGKTIVYLSKRADTSTLFHELIHVAEDNLTHEERKLAVQALNGKITVKGRRIQLSDDFDSWTAEERRDFSEGFAATAEAWATAGTAPREMRGIFEKLAEFMRKIYDTLKAAAALSPEADKFFQDFFAGRIAEQAEQNGMRGADERGRGTDAEAREATGPPNAAEINRDSPWNLYDIPGSQNAAKGGRLASERQQWSDTGTNQLKENNTPESLAAIEVIRNPERHTAEERKAAIDTLAHEKYQAENRSVIPKRPDGKKVDIAQGYDTAPSAYEPQSLGKGYEEGIGLSVKEYIEKRPDLKKRLEGLQEGSIEYGREIRNAHIQDITNPELREKVSALYEAAEGHREDFRTLAGEIKKEVKEQYGIDAEVKARSALKGIARAIQKTMTDNSGDINRLVDLDGVTFETETLDGVLNILDIIKQKYKPTQFDKTGAAIKSGEITVDRIKDRIAEPLGAGYRDSLLNIRFPDGYVTEIQINNSEMLAAKGKGHLFYEVERDLLEKKKALLEKGQEVPQGITDTINTAITAMRKIYGTAYALSRASDSTGRALSMTSDFDAGEELVSINSGVKRDAAIRQSLSEKTIHGILESSKAIGMSESPKNKNVLNSSTDRSGLSEYNTPYGLDLEAGTSIATSATSVPSTTNIGQTAENVKGGSDKTVDTSGLPAMRAEYEAAPKTYGRTGTVNANGERRKGRYVLAEAGTFKSSHNPRFEQTPNFPTRRDGSTANDNDYKNRPDAQEVTLAIAASVDQRAFGIIVTREGAVANGNGRNNAVQIAYENGTAEQYLEDLRENIAGFGLTEADLDACRNPEIAFELEDDFDYSTESFAQFNVDTRKGADPTDTAIKMGKRLADNPKLLARITESINRHETIDDLYKDKEAVGEIFTTLQREKITGAGERSKFISGRTGNITAQGKSFLESLLLGGSLTEANIRTLDGNGETEKIRKRLVKAITPIAENMAMGEYAIWDELNDAVRIAAEVAKNPKEFTGVREFARQRNLFTPENRLSLEIAARLEEGTQQEFVDFMQGLNRLLAEAAEGQGDMFSAESREDILRRYLDVRGDVRFSLEETIQDDSAPLKARAAAALDIAGYERALAAPDAADRAHGPTAALLARAAGIADAVERERVMGEIRALRERYAGTGGEYKAPNGKATLLTPEQWYAVRTPSFKQWFGDWETLQELDVSGKEASAEQAVEYMKTLAGKDLINIATSIPARINSTQRNKIVSLTALEKSQKNGFTAQQHNTAATIIDKLWKHAEQVESGSDKGNDKNIVSIKRFAAPIVFSNETGIAYITAKETVEHGHRIYSLELQEIKKPWNKGGTPDGDTTSKVSNEIIVKLLEKVNPSEVSKVIDANGEPLVVYHGTGAGDFAVFNDNSFFTNKKQTAEQYAAQLQPDGTLNSRVYEVFLNIRNPKEIQNLFTVKSDKFKALAKKSTDAVVSPMGNTEATEYIVKNSNQIKSATDNAGTFSNENPSILFQSGEALADEAAGYGSWQEFRDAYEGEGRAGAAEDAWYKSFYESALKIAGGDEERGGGVLFSVEEGGRPELDDEQFLETDITRENLDEFVKKAYNVLKTDTGLASEALDEGLDVKTVKRQQYRIYQELVPNGSWARYIWAAGREDLSPVGYRTLRRLIEKAPRDFRSLYADLMGRSDLAENLGGPAAPLAAPRLEQEDLMDEKHREAIARQIPDPALARLVRDGALTMDDEQFNRYMAEKEKAAAEAEGRLAEMEKEQAEDYGNIARAMGKEIAGIYLELQEAGDKLLASRDLAARRVSEGKRLTREYAKERQVTQATYDEVWRRWEDATRAERFNTEAQVALARRDERSQARIRAAEERRILGMKAAVREIKQFLIKRIVRPVSFKTIAYDQAVTIKAIQRIFRPSLFDGLNAWMGTGNGPLPRLIWSRYDTDEKYRAELKSRADENAWGRMEKILSKRWEFVTQKEKETLVRLMPKRNYVAEFNLTALAREDEESVQLDMAAVEGEDGRTRVIPGQSMTRQIQEALGEDLYNRLLYKDLAEWTLRDMEDLAKAVDDLTMKGRQEERARKEAEKAREERARAEVTAALKKTGIEINDDDSPEEKEKKQARIAKILNKYADGKRKNNLFNNFFDADLRRFTAALDGGRKGVFTELLYWGEDRAYNNEQRAILARRMAVEASMREHHITLEELYAEVKIAGLEGADLLERNGGRGLTVDDLLYILRGLENGYTRKAIVYGVLSNANERKAAEEARSLEIGIDEENSTAIANFAKLAEGRLALVKKAADEFFAKEENKKFLDFAAVIGRDYDANGERLNRFCIDTFNRPMWREDFYVPMYRYDQSGAENENRVIEDLLGAEKVGRRQVNKGSTLSRVNISPFHQAGIELGLYKTWVQSVESTEHLVAYGALVKKLNAVFKSNKASALRETLGDRWGEAAVKYISNTIGEMANPNPAKHRGGLDDIIRWGRGKTATAYLGWKLSSVLKQAVTSPWPYLQEIAPNEYLGAMFQQLQNPKALWDFIAEKSIYMKNRDFDMMLTLIREAMKKTNNPAGHFLDRVNQMGMKGLELVDRAAVFPGWLAVYKKELVRLTAERDEAYQKKLAEYHEPQWDDVLPDEEAKARRALEETAGPDEVDAGAVALADDAVRRMQPPGSRKVDLAPFLKTNNELAAAFVQFQTALNVIWQQIRYDLPLAVREKEFGRAAGMVSGYVLASLGLGLLANWPGDDDKKEKDGAYWARWALFNSMTQFTDSVPVIGDYVTRLAEKTITGKSVYRGGADILPVVEKAFGGAIGLASIPWTEDSGQAMEKAGRALESALGAGFIAGGLPVSGMLEGGRVTGIGDKDGELAFNPGALLGRR